MNLPNLEQEIVVRSHQPGGPYFIDLLLEGSVSMSLGPYYHRGVGERDARQLKNYFGCLLLKRGCHDEQRVNGTSSAAMNDFRVHAHGSTPAAVNVSTQEMPPANEESCMT
jgi:hypothetical protein